MPAVSAPSLWAQKRTVPSDQLLTLVRPMKASATEVAIAYSTLLTKLAAIRETSFGMISKAMIRQVVLSRAYQLGSSHDARNFEVDPDNTLVWRMSPKRLEAEAVRGGEEGGRVRGGQAEHVEVDDAVEAAQSLGPGFAFVQGRSQGPADTAADQADQPGCGVPGRGRGA